MRDIASVRNALRRMKGGVAVSWLIAPTYL